MSKNLFVGGFPYQTTKEELAVFFASCGTVTHAKVILDRETGRPKGFGFVEMSTEEEAQAAVEKLNGSLLGTRKIFVTLGRPQDERERRPFTDPPATHTPGFVERRSGKERRQGGSSADTRRDSDSGEGQRWEKKSYPENKSKPWGEKKPWGDKPAAEGKPWAKKSFGDKKPFGENKPWGKKPFGEKKAWGDKPAGKTWEKKPWGESSSASGKKWDKKPFDKNPAGKKKIWEKKPWDKMKPKGR